MTEFDQLIDSLQDRNLYDHPVDSFEVIETHISWVILTGPYAYKLKKPVKFDFVDFSNLAKRKTYCGKELELNRRLAPDLYEKVVTITGSRDRPQLDGSSSPIEYAVKMREFPQDNLFSEQVKNGDLPPESVDELAELVDEFHRSISCDPPSEDYASPDLIRNNMEENFDAIDQSELDKAVRGTFTKIHNWSFDRFGELRDRFEERRQNGFVRNCHGDMHLRNIVRFEDEINVFDCIEFNESFRWIDVMDEVAFLTMDLVDRGQPKLANRFLDRYLSLSGDYGGLQLLGFYQTYRAMVRCKVSYLENDSGTENQGLPEEFFEYLETAESFVESPRPLIVITHGLSGSGKTFVTQRLLEEIGAIRLRSDVERKRLAGLERTNNQDEGINEGLYSDEMTHRTYNALEEKAETVVEAGYPAIVDATFLKEDYRKKFRGLSDHLEVPFRLLNVTCPEPELRRRLKERQRSDDSVSDAGIDVLENQMETKDPLNEGEKSLTIEIDTDGDGLTRDKIETLRVLSE